MTTDCPKCGKLTSYELLKQGGGECPWCLKEKFEKQNPGCTCQNCELKYKVDIIVPDELWERIKPAGKQEGAGLLCGRCIVDALERLEYSKYDLKPDATEVGEKWEQAHNNIEPIRKNLVADITLDM